MAYQQTLNMIDLGVDPVVKVVNIFDTLKVVIKGESAILVTSKESFLRGTVRIDFYSWISILVTRKWQHE